MAQAKETVVSFDTVTLTITLPTGHHIRALCRFLALARPFAVCTRGAHGLRCPPFGFSSGYGCAAPVPLFCYLPHSKWSHYHNRRNKRYTILSTHLVGAQRKNIKPFAIVIIFLLNSYFASVCMCVRECARVCVCASPSMLVKLCESSNTYILVYILYASGVCSVRDRLSDSMAEQLK